MQSQRVCGEFSFEASLVFLAEIMWLWVLSTLSPATTLFLTCWRASVMEVSCRQFICQPQTVARLSLVIFSDVFNLAVFFRDILSLSYMPILILTNGEEGWEGIIVYLVESRRKRQKETMNMGIIFKIIPGYIITTCPICLHFGRYCFSGCCQYQSETKSCIESTCSLTFPIQISPACLINTITQVYRLM